MDIEFPEKLDFLFDPYRYKVAYGGRGSAKSWSFARALLVHGAGGKLRVLCAREVQKSIKDSVHKLLSDQIEAMGLGGFYEILETVIRGKNGTEFSFSGLATHTVESIKSFEGADVVWVEEAQSVSKRSWDVLIPTIRKPDSEIWITFNPNLDTDETYTRFVLSPPPNSRVVMMNYHDNPWFPQVLEHERLHCQATNAEDYANIWEGKCRTAVAGAIYAHEIAASLTDGRVCNIPYDPTLKVHTIWDLGWNDSMSIMLVQRVRSEIRVIEYIEDSHKTLDHYASLLNGKAMNWGNDYLPHDGRTRDFKTGKSAEEILHRFGRKVKITPSISVEDGIKAARMMFHQVYFDKAKNQRLIECLKRYRRSINQQTNEPGAPLHDEYSHGCLVAGTMVKTARGDVPIESVEVGDMVHTPAGLAKVSASGPVKVADRLLEITDSKGNRILATVEHKFFTTRGLLLADELRYNDVLSLDKISCVKSESIRSMGYRGAFIESFKDQYIGTGRKETFIVPKRTGINGFCIASFMSQFMDQLSLIMRFSQLTEIFRTLLFQIGTFGSVARYQEKESTPCLSLTGYCITGNQTAISSRISRVAVTTCTGTCGGILMEKYQNIAMSITRIATKATTALRTLRCFLMVSIQSYMQKQINGSEAKQTKINSQLRRSKQKIGIRAQMVGLGTLFMRRLHGQIESGMKKNAVSVEENIKHHIQQDQNTVIRIAGLRRLDGEEARQLVYDLTVEKHHCYLANGFLVSNSDCFRYMAINADSLSNDDMNRMPNIPAFKPLTSSMGY